jgi:hypothetical protein
VFTIRDSISQPLKLAPHGFRWPGFQSRVNQGKNGFIGLTHERRSLSTANTNTAKAVTHTLKAKIATTGRVTSKMMSII